MSARPLVIVACGATKTATAEQARDLYTGSTTQLGIRAALTLTTAPNARILSGRHGFVSLDTTLEPYEQRIDKPGAITTAELEDQAAEAGLLTRPHVIVLGGRAYADRVRALWPHAEAPLLGSRGIGEHRKRLACIISAGAQ